MSHRSVRARLQSAPQVCFRSTPSGSPKARHLSIPQTDTGLTTSYISRQNERYARFQGFPRPAWLELPSANGTFMRRTRVSTGPVQLLTKETHLCAQNGHAGLASRTVPRSGPADCHQFGAAAPGPKPAPRPNQARLRPRVASRIAAVAVHPAIVRAVAKSSAGDGGSAADMSRPIRTALRRGAEPRTHRHCRCS